MLSFLKKNAWMCGAVAVVGCGTQEEPKKVAPVEAAKPAVAAAAPKTDPDCVGPISAGEAKAVTIGDTSWEVAGSTLTQKTPAEGDSIVIGALTDIKEDSPENMENLKAFAKWFAARKVNMVVVDGDTGETASQIENAISVFAEMKVPVLSILGNREGRAAHKAAMTALAAKYPNVFNLVNIRRVDTPALDLISMPGYHNPEYIHAADGCAYNAEDAEGLTTLAKASNSPIMLISHGPPQQEGTLALDRIAAGGNVGDPKLAKIMAENKIAFGIFGNIHEAGGKATDLAGKTVIPQKTMVDALYVHPGAADGVRWSMNDGTESVGMAAVITVKAGKASYEVMHIEDTQKKVAKAGKGEGKKAKK